MLSELDEVIHKLIQGRSVSQLSAAGTTDISGEEIDRSQSRREARSKRTFKMKKSHATDELARFLETVPTEAKRKLSDFYCRMRRKDVSKITHGSSKFLRHFYVTLLFLSDQRFRLESPGWRVFDFGSNLLTEDELERQRDKILQAALVVTDREYPFNEDLIPDASGSVELQLLILAKMSSFVDVVQLGGSYELVKRLWERFLPTASRTNITAPWSRDEGLIGSVFSPEF